MTSAEPPPDARPAASTRALSLQLVAQAVTTAGISVWRLDLATDEVSGNPEFFRLVGLPADSVSVPAHRVRALMHPDDRGHAKALTEALLRTGVPQESELRYMLADGRCLHLLSRRSLQRGADGRPQAVLGVTLDVTSFHEQRNRALQEARRFELAVGAAGIGTWEWWPRTGVARWDEQMFRLRGLEPQPQALADEERMALVHPDDRDAVRAAMRDAADRQAPLSIEFRVVRADGQVRWIASRSVDVPDGETGQLRRIGANWDVTDRRAAEQARREAEGALRESQAKSRFLARMSHELRTPLNAVLGFAQLLLTDDGATISGRGLTRRQSLEHIHRAGRHLASLIDEVLDLASIESGEMTLVRERVSLDELVAHTLPLLVPQARAAGVELVVGRLELAVLADAKRLRQVLLNLLSNGVKYNRPGGEVGVEAVAAGALVHLRVRDTGRGIAPARLPELFQPFNRLGAEHEAIEGSGIGLAIVRSLVEHMGGHVQVSSEPGRGSVFEVVLPKAAAPAPQQAGRVGEVGAPGDSRGSNVAGRAEGAAGRRSATPGAADHATTWPAAGNAAPLPRRVLYVEDNEVNALIVRELIATMPGYELRIAADGAAGLTMAREWPAELVLLDMQLPDMDGFAVLRGLRESPRTAGLPVVALSANVLPDQVSRGLAAGLTDYWAKPLDIPRFLERLAAVLPARAE